MIAWKAGMKPLSAAWGILAATLLAGPSLTPAGQSARKPLASDMCTPAGRLSSLPALPEASGVAHSRRSPGLLWSHNDSGEPIVVALDAAGVVKGRVRVAGARVTDWEDITVGPCAQGSCLYIADIGDNNRARRQITVYKVAEPRPGDSMTEPAEAWAGTYPDGGHDAEGAFMTPAGDLFIVTKESAATTAIYRLPRAQGNAPARLQVAAKVPVAGVTGADASTDGNWVALRTNDELLFYRTRDLLAGARGEPQRFNLRALREPQGEGVAFGPEGVVYLVGEGGRGGGTFATLHCRLR